MKRLAISLLVPLSLLGCAADDPESFIDPGQFDEANPALGRGVAEYDATLAARASGASEVITALTGWTCNTTAGMHYSEVQLDHNGEAQRISHEQSAGFGWFGSADTRMPFTRNLDHRSPVVESTVHHNCSRNVVVPCTQAQKDAGQTICHKSEAFSIYWDCEMTDLPTSPGQSITRSCESRSTFWGFLNQFSWAAAFRDLEVESTVTFVAARTQFDYNNCNAGNGEPFYLRLSQGVGGHFLEDDFVLYVDVDGEPVVQTPSTSGLYSIALAYCPDGDQDEITVNLSAIEDDLIWDDEYTAEPGSTNMTVGRGETRQVTLVRDGLFGESSSTVLLEVFGQE